MADPRLFISTDMQMITGVNNRDGDKDDVQSLVHALMYQDKFDIVGIASSTSQHQPGANDVRFIHHVLDQYDRDDDRLMARSDEFKSADELRDITYQGTKSLAGSSGAPGATDASRAIIAEAREAAAAGEKLYVATWGGIGDVARALKDAPDIADDIRLLSASGPRQEANAYRFVKDEFAGEGELWWVDAQNTQKGIYASPAGRLPPMSNSWSNEHAKGHGALGDLFHNNTIDVRGAADDINGVKMGDSWTVFYLIDNANNEDPTQNGWGGQYRRVDDKYWADRTDIKWGWEDSNGAATTYDDRAAWTSDFANRLDWLRSGGETGSKAPVPTPTPNPTPAPSADDNDLVLSVSGDAWNGDPKFEVHVDGRLVGTYTTSADRADGEWQTVVVRGDFDDDGTSVRIVLKDAHYGGSPDKDQNVYVRSASIDGTTVGAETALKKNGSSLTWTVGSSDDRDDDDDGDDHSGGDTGGPASGTDTITVRATGMEYNGDPNFKISVDGRLIDATNLVTADEKDGEWMVLTFEGEFSPNGDQRHEVELEFTNDVYGGPGKDRNIQIDEVTFNGEVNDMDHRFRSNSEMDWDFVV